MRVKVARKPEEIRRRLIAELNQVREDVYAIGASIEGAVIPMATSSERVVRATLQRITRRAARATGGKMGSQAAERIPLGAGNWDTVTPQRAQLLLDALDDFEAASQERHATLAEQIEATTDVRKLLQIDLRQGWPNSAAKVHRGTS